jgi:hypothetical protein
MKRVAIFAAVFVVGALFGAGTLAAVALITVPESSDECHDELDVRPKFRNLLRNASAVTQVPIATKPIE